MKKLSEAQISAILKEKKEGLSEREIAKKVGCSRSAVWYQLQKVKTK
jgi:biotin operon repressor